MRFKKDRAMRRILYTFVMLASLSAAAWSQPYPSQNIVTDPPSTTHAPSGPFEFDVLYSTTPPNIKTTGVHLMMFWNNSKINLASITSIAEASFLLAMHCDDPDFGSDGNCMAPSIQVDTDNADSDATTSHYIAITFVAIFGGFPTAMDPAHLFTANWTALPGLGPSETTWIQFTGFGIGGPVLVSPHVVTRGATVPPAVTIVATDELASEAGPDGGVFTLTRTASNGALNVNYTLTGTADNGIDYTALPGMVTFVDGSATATVGVAPIDDSTVEFPETVILTLAAGNGYIIAPPGVGTVIITENDAVVSVEASDPTASEPANAGTFTFTRTIRTGPLTVQYTVDGTATSGTDYSALPGTVSFVDGAPTATVTVGPIDDTLIEPPLETVTVTVQGGTGYFVGTRSRATVTIADNESVGAGTLSGPGGNLSSGGPSCPATLNAFGPGVTFTMGLTGPAPAAGTLVTITSSAPGLLTFPESFLVPAGETIATFTVTPGGALGTTTLIASAGGSSASCIVRVILGPPPPPLGTPTSIPTASEYGLALLAMLLAGAGLFIMRRM